MGSEMCIRDSDSSIAFTNSTQLLFYVTGSAHPFIIAHTQVQLLGNRTTRFILWPSRDNKPARDVARTLRTNTTQVGYPNRKSEESN